MKQIMAVLSVFMLLATSAFADNTQSKKNNDRNIGLGSAAVGLYGLSQHNRTLGVLGAAGTVYGASAYEQQRHRQSQEQSRRDGNYYRGDNNYRDNRDFHDNRDYRKNGPVIIFRDGYYGYYDNRHSWHRCHRHYDHDRSYWGY